MVSKNGFYKKGEWEHLEKKRIYHAKCVDVIENKNKLLTYREKKKIFNSISI